MQSLQTLLDLLVKGRALHISVLDLSGILSTPLTKLDFKSTIHSKAFCDVAKSTDQGYRACLHCKRLANERAANQKKPFAGHCAYGIYEAAQPVVINGAVVAVVYVGNAVVAEDLTRGRICRMSRLTGVSEQALLQQMAACEHLARPEELAEMAEVVADYLCLLAERAPGERPRMHWLVALLKRHADEMYSNELSLKNLASVYQKNEKYLGRLFKKEMGVSFHEYCAARRMKRAEELLVQTDQRVLDIAMECGYNNISYFNRTFFGAHGMTPTAYRTCHT